jgi:ABC-type uncharacterized transport system ATPase subunit
MTKTSGASPRSTMSRSRFPPARSTRCSARTAPASRRWSNASWASIRPTRATLLLDGRRSGVRNPRDAQALGVGMVYQHFTLVPALTAAENLVLAAPTRRRSSTGARSAELEAFLARMPFRVPLDRPVSAGGRREAEARNPQAALSRPALPHPGRADLGADARRGRRDPRPARDMAHRGEITVLMITHKFREVMAFCDDVTCCAAAPRSAAARSAISRRDEMAAMMIGDAVVRPSAGAHRRPRAARLEIAGLFARERRGREAVAGLRSQGRPARSSASPAFPATARASWSRRSPASGRSSWARSSSATGFRAQRDHFARFKVFGLPEEPLKNATVADMSVAENMAFREFDKPPIARCGWWLSRGRCAPGRAN